MSRRFAVPVIVAKPGAQLTHHRIRLRAGCDCPRRHHPLPGWPVAARLFVIAHRNTCHPAGLVEPLFIALREEGALA